MSSRPGSSMARPRALRSPDEPPRPRPEQDISEGERRGLRPAGRDASAWQDREFVCLVGPSGCGKSTLLKIIAGLLEPDPGSVDFDSAPADGRPRNALVFQEHGLFPWMTVLRNVAFGLRMRGTGRREAEREGPPLHRAGGSRRLRPQLPSRAVRRDAPAGQPRPRPARRSADPAHGRAVRVPGRADAARAAAGAAPDLGRDPQDRDLRDPRHRGSGADGRPGARHERPSGPHPRTTSASRCRGRATSSATATPPPPRSRGGSGASSRTRCGRASGAAAEARVPTERWVTRGPRWVPVVVVALARPLGALGPGRSRLRPIFYPPPSSIVEALARDCGAARWPRPSSPRVSRILAGFCLRGRRRSPARSLHGLVSRTAARAGSAGRGRPPRAPHRDAAAHPAASSASVRPRRLIMVAISAFFPVLINTTAGVTTARAGLLRGRAQFRRPPVPGLQRRRLARQPALHRHRDRVCPW